MNDSLKTLLIIGFVLLTIAAWTSAISLIEPAVAYLVERRELSRPVAAALIGGAVWLVGLATVFSFNVWADATVTVVGQAFTAFTAIEFLTSNIALPLGGLLIAVFAGWVMSKGSTLDEFERGASVGYHGWRLLIRWVVPVALLVMFLHVTGLLRFGE